MKSSNRAYSAVNPKSPPSRGAWIEIVICTELAELEVMVAPLAGGVD